MMISKTTSLCSFLTLAVALVISLQADSAHAFLPTAFRPRTSGMICQVVSSLTEDDEEVDIDFLFEEADAKPKYEDLDVTEKAWRYAKKPLLRIGSKGATHSHGNSLRQLLDDHKVVKVKVNTKKYHDSVQEAYEVLRSLAIENGASPDIELIQLREGSKEILFGLPGTLEKMEEGKFPPPPPRDESSEEER